MTMITSDRLDHLDRMIAEGRIIRRNWGKTTYRGQETACLLAALSPEAGLVQSAEACPTQIMPLWLAHLTIWMDDAGSKETWSAMILRYAELARRWDVLTDEDWQRLCYMARRVEVEEVVSYIPDGAGSKERAVSTHIIALCHGAEAGDFPTKLQWEIPTINITPMFPWTDAAWATTRMIRAGLPARLARIATANAVEARAAAAERWGMRFTMADQITALILGAIETMCDHRVAQWIKPKK